MISFNANTSPLPLPYCFRICLMLWRLGYMSLLALIFGSLLMYRETNLLNVVDVWLMVSYVSIIVRLDPVMDRFTFISRISSGSYSSLTSSATSSPCCSFSCCSPFSFMLLFLLLYLFFLLLLLLLLLLL